MKKSIYTLILFIFCVHLNSCVTVKTHPGKHKGWFKNPNNPHHPKTTNPGHTKAAPKKAAVKTNPGKAKGKNK